VATTTTSRGALDCQACGACCVNLPSNRAEGFTSWVEIEDGARILERPDLVRLIVRDDDGVPHLRLAPDGRCLALRGALGRTSRCTVYHDRPRACRRVQPGDADCVRARREHGLA
jgi:Fe-S-cluster containining protein